MLWLWCKLRGAPMKKKSRLAAFFFSSLSIASCAAGTCSPGNYDGAWEAIGRPPPNYEEVKQRLVGMRSAAADDFFGIKGDDEIENSSRDTVVRSWIFQRKKELLHRSCEAPDEVVFRQDVFWVKAVMQGDVVRSCSMGVKGSIANRLLTNQEILRAPLGPLDESLGSCSGGQSGR